MYPLLFHLGPLAVPSYTALFDIGLLGGALIAYLAARRRGLNPVQVLDAALAATLAGVISAHAIYVAANWAYYGDHPQQAFRLWDGGLALTGATTFTVGLFRKRRSQERQR